MGSLSYVVCGFSMCRETYGWPGGLQDRGCGTDDFGGIAVLARRQPIGQEQLA